MKATNRMQARATALNNALLLCCPVRVKRKLSNTYHRILSFKLALSLNPNVHGPSPMRCGWSWRGGMTGAIETRFLQSEQSAQALGLGAADGNFGLLFVVHAQLVRALEPGDDFLDAVDINEIGPVRPPEDVGVEALQKLLERPAVRLAFHAVGAGGRDRDHTIFDGGEANFFLIDQEQPSRGLQQDFRGLGALRLEHADQGFQFLGRGRDALHLDPCLLYRLRHPLLVKRLQQVVDGVHFKGLDGILIVGGREDNFRQGNFLVEKFLDYAEAIETGHLHVEKDHVGAVLADQVDTLDSVLSLSHDVHIAGVLEQVGELVPRQLLVIHDDRRQRHQRLLPAERKYSERHEAGSI